MKIGLINPNKELKHPAVHIGLGYIASYARQQHADITFELIDTRIAKPKELEVFFNTPFDLFGITASSQVFLEAVEIASMLKEKYPQTPICLGGSHVSTVGEKAILNFPFDFAVYGEGEVTFSELIAFFKGQKDLPSIHGLIYKEDGNKIVKTPFREIFQDINLLPFPAYDLFKMNRYPQHRMTTSRGCPYDCVFCNSHSLWTHKWRKRSAENVVEEIKHLIKNYTLKTIVFNDDSFNIDLKRVEAFCDLLIEEKLNVIWSTSLRADRITPILAQKMRQSGCYNVSIGIESANNEVLEKMNKHTTIEKISNGIQIFRDAGIDVMGQFMIGNPGDTLETVKESIAFAKNSKLTGVEFYTALPYEDSILWSFVQKHGTLLTDVECYQYHTISPRIIYETPEFTYNERLEAIALAKSNGFYDALSKDRKSFLLDIGKNSAKMMQKVFKGKFGNRMYLWLRKMYHKI